MSRHLYVLAALSSSVLALGACTSARLAGNEAPPVRSTLAPGPVEAMPAEPIETAPLSPIETQPLPPISGTPAPSGSMAGPGGTDLAALPPPASAPAPASRTSMVGSWTAQVPGGACRVQLSSAPALDLYRASVASCSNQDLSRVNAWDYREGEVYLYQSGGAVAARLRGSSGSLNGALMKSGAPLSLTR